MHPLGKKRRSFDQKFKEAAVEMYLNGQRSGRAVALDLGIPHRTLRSWVKKLRSSVPAMPQTPAQLQAQLRSARAELQSLRNQCEILKKTLTILSHPPSAAKE
jgi:transposase-like protein